MRTTSTTLVLLALAGGVLGLIGGCARSPDERVCGALGADDCASLLAMRLPAELPAARGNRFGDDPRAAELGFRLFFDADLGTGVACVSCHEPELTFANHDSVSTGKLPGLRNTPTVFNVARLRVFLWDGSVDSVWSQPLVAIENPREMGSSRTALAQRVARDFASEYEAIFGPLPDRATWPATGKPGDAAFDTLPIATQTDIDRVAANIGKAFEAYLRKNTSGDAPFDVFLDGEPLLPAAQAGARAFVTNGCASCHRGPMLTDESFHDVGFPSLPGAAPDLGYATGRDHLLANPFNLSGPFADPSDPVATSAGSGFRTPSLRHVARTAPYGHDGALSTLGEVLAVHAPTVHDEDRGDIIAFLQTLNGNIPPRPWSNWPSAQ